MEEAQKAIDALSQVIDELRSTGECQTKIMNETKQVILDCYAEWCAPCQKLTPMLEAKALEFEGQFKLVKMDIEAVPDISTGLQIRNIPAVFLIYKGNIVDQFVGMPTSDE